LQQKNNSDFNETATGPKLNGLISVNGDYSDETASLLASIATPVTHTRLNRNVGNLSPDITLSGTGSVKAKSRKAKPKKSMKTSDTDLDHVSTRVS